MYTWVAKGDRKIVCDSWEAFCEIAAKFFPELSYADWTLVSK